jgi:hypothetical protein
MREGIEGLWLNPASWTAESWMEHRDINVVMLAASLIPHGYLGLAPKR